MPTVDDILSYCHNELANESSSHRLSSAASSRWQTTQMTEFSWQVASVCDKDLQPKWVGLLDINNLIIIIIIIIILFYCVPCSRNYRGSGSWRS